MKDISIEQLTAILNLAKEIRVLCELEGAKLPEGLTVDMAIATSFLQCAKMAETDINSVRAVILKYADIVEKAKL